jgi:serum/glucocorticoid-regulated kinase 2
LEKDPVNRLGTKDGIDEIIRHPFLQSIDFDKLVAKQIEPPFRPKLSSDLFDVS